jgi:HTH-type transcriptional regulator / antitoxin HipB
MDYPLNTPAEIRAVLRALRTARGLTQAEAGRLLGVSQKRIARIEAAPEKTSFGQVVRLITILGGRIAAIEAKLKPARKAKAEGW